MKFIKERNNDKKKKKGFFKGMLSIYNSSNKAISSNMNKTARLYKLKDEYVNSFEEVIDDEEIALFDAL